MGPASLYGTCPDRDPDRSILSLSNAWGGFVFSWGGIQRRGKLVPLPVRNKLLGEST